jgi:hypothetical protein
MSNPHISLHLLHMSGPKNIPYQTVTFALIKFPFIASDYPCCILPTML